MRCACTPDKVYDRGGTCTHMHTQEHTPSGLSSGTSCCPSGASESSSPSSVSGKRSHAAPSLLRPAYCPAHRGASVSRPALFFSSISARKGHLGLPALCTRPSALQVKLGFWKAQAPTPPVPDRWASALFSPYPRVGSSSWCSGLDKCCKSFLTGRERWCPPSASCLSVRAQQPGQPPRHGWPSGEATSTLPPTAAACC